MDAGLKTLLAAIKRAPSAKLIERFLALIADYKDDNKKAKAALALAKMLVKTDPNEAIRIAHMVYKWDRENIEALDIVIAGLKSRGRHGKAEVLAIERNKLVKHMEQTGASDPGSFADIEVSQVMELEALTDGDPAMARSPEPKPAPKRTEVSAHKSAQKTTVRDRREGERLPQGVVAQSVPPQGDHRRKSPQRARESLPIHLDILGDAEGGATQKIDDLFKPMAGQPPASEPVGDASEDAVDLLFEAPSPAPEAKTVKLPPEQVVAKERQFQREQATRMTGGLRGDSPAKSVRTDATGRSPSLSLDPSVVKPIPKGPAPDVHSSELGVAVEMFDYYWQQGFVDQARDLLKQTAKVAGDEPWWRARNELLGRSRPIEPASQIDSDSAPSKSDFWSEINSELGRLAGRIDIAKLTPSPSSEIPEPLPTEALEALVRIMRAMEGETKEQTLSRQWEIVSGMWADRPHPDCADLLATLELQHATPGFWGVYLDSYLVGRRARQCLQEIRRWLPERPRLAWCQAAYDRLPLIWQAMDLKAFTWCEDDGVWPLLRHLAERPGPTMRGMIAMGEEKPR